MASPPELHLSNQICLSLYSATNALLRAYRSLLEPLGLTYPQYLVMLALWEEDDRSVTGICQATRLETGTVTPVLKRLERKGLIERGRSEVDERMRVISLSREGALLARRAVDVPAALGCLGALTPRQGQQLKQLAETLYGNLRDVESA
ncbi:MAG: MarR family transcriptional regulator [Pseudomonadales bacterium]